LVTAGPEHERANRAIPPNAIVAAGLKVFSVVVTASEPSRENTITSQSVTSRHQRAEQIAQHQPRRIREQHHQR
jgi:predicted solute-binding protein